MSKIIRKLPTAATWARAKDLYVHTDGTCKQIGDLLGIVPQTVSTRCKRESWVELREKRVLVEQSGVPQADQPLTNPPWATGIFSPDAAKDLLAPSPTGQLSTTQEPAFTTIEFQEFDKQIASDLLRDIKRARLTAAGRGYNELEALKILVPAHQKASEVGRIVYGLDDAAPSRPGGNVINIVAGGPEPVRIVEGHDVE